VGKALKKNYNFINYEEKDIDQVKQSHSNRGSIGMTAATANMQQPYLDPNDPSKFRRERLMSEVTSSAVQVSSFFKLDGYYAAANKVKDAFVEAIENNNLDNAYVFGKRYCFLVFEAIPTHNYFKSPKFQRERLEYFKDGKTILDQLEQIKVQMDEEEKVRYQKRLIEWKKEQARLEQERKRQQEILAQREKAKYQELLKRAEMQRKTSIASIASESKEGEDVQQSAMSKLELLMKKADTTPATAPSPPKEPPRRPSGRYGLMSDTDEDDEEEDVPGYSIAVGEPLPPPLPPPADSSMNGHTASTGSLPPPPEAPPGYDSATNRHNPFLGRCDAPYAVPPPVQPWEGSNNYRPPNYSTLPDPPTRRYPAQQQNGRYNGQQPPPQKRKKKVPVRHLRDKARRQYHDLLDEGRIEVRPIGTYQGRYSQSTNGCTVISPLVVARHLATPSGVVLPDSAIQDVIDNECGPLLREIRGKLGLDNHSLIIPSDVHDHLVDKNILKQDYFVGATGGNIVSEEHIGEFLKLFKEKDKAGAALFFREHVVSIVKLPVGGGGKAYYDLVDSMPGTKDARNNPCASRTRCKDAEALDVLLTWYATKKFSESNCSYIDNNDWNDSMADLDPRVFQAFVWGKDA